MTKGSKCQAVTCEVSRYQTLRKLRMRMTDFASKNVQLMAQCDTRRVL